MPGMNPMMQGMNPMMQGMNPMMPGFGAAGLTSPKRPVTGLDDLSSLLDNLDSAVPQKATTIRNDPTDDLSALLDQISPPRTPISPTQSYQQPVMRTSSKIQVSNDDDLGALLDAFDNSQPKIPVQKGSTDALADLLGELGL